LFRAQQKRVDGAVGGRCRFASGEVVALRTDDLSGRTLSIVRASQDGVIAPVKNHLVARLTVGADTAACWSRYVQRWQNVVDQGPWMFTGTLERRVPLRPDALGHRFIKLARAAGLPEASLQRLRHTVGTYLVAQGKILQASQRLRHRDLSTTFREYVHALPLDDQDVADRLARLYGLDTA